MKFVINTNYEKAGHLLAWIIKDIEANLPKDSIEILQTVNHPDFSKVNKSKGEPYIINLLVNYIDKSTGAINIDIPNNYILSTIGNNLVRNLKEKREYLMYLTNTIAVVENKVSREDLSIRLILPKSKIFHQQGTQLIEEIGIAVMSVLDPLNPYTPSQFKLSSELMEEMIESLIPEEANQREYSSQYAMLNKEVQESLPNDINEEENHKPKTVEEDLDDLMSDFEEVDLDSIPREPVTAEPPKGLFEDMRDLTEEEEKSYVEALENNSEPTGEKLFKEESNHNNHQPQKSVFGGNKNKKKNKNK